MKTKLIEQKKSIVIGVIPAGHYDQRPTSVVLRLHIENKPQAINYSTLFPVKNVPIISICADLIVGGKDVGGGQSIDLVKQYFKSKKAKRIVELWEQYHCTDLTAGNKKQTDILEKWDGYKKADYTQCCAYLKTKKVHTSNGYEYGTKWLYKPVPREIIEELIELFN